MKLDKALRYLKYVILAVFVFALQSVMNEFGIGRPFFCSTSVMLALSAGIPLLIKNESPPAYDGHLVRLEDDSPDCKSYFRR